MTSRVGQQLGNYRLIHLLGTGGFAEVYLGEHIHLKSQAAIKVLRANVAERDMVRFKHEATLIAGLRHAHIVRIFDFDVEDGTPFLVMDYAPNGTLRQRHPSGTPTPPATVVPYIKQLADALHYAHQNRIIHRDIKPENMLIAANNDILLSDFGLALFTQSSSFQTTYEVAGTVSYMAPEQVQGKPRPESDQYALGVVVYEWLTGSRPFEGSFLEIATKQVLAPPQPLREKVPLLPQALEEVVMIALSKAPTARFATLLAFARAFEEAAMQQNPSFATLPAKADPSFQQQAFSFYNTRQEPPPATLPTTNDASLFAAPSQPAPFPPTPERVPGPLSDGSSPTIQQRASISRRAAIIGLAGIALGGMGIGSWLLLSRLLTPTPTQTPPGASSSASAGKLRWRFQTGNAIKNAPAFADGVVYAGSFDNSLYAIQAASGTKSWSFAVQAAPSYSQVAVAQGTVYFAADDDTIYALRASDGSVLWKYAIQGLGQSLVSGNTLYLASTDNSLYALNASTGSLIWRFQSGGPIHSTPELANGVVYVGSTDHYLIPLAKSFP